MVCEEHSELYHMITTIWMLNYGSLDFFFTKIIRLQTHIFLTDIHINFTGKFTVSTSINTLLLQVLVDVYPVSTLTKLFVRLWPAQMYFPRLGWVIYKRIS